MSRYPTLGQAGALDGLPQPRKALAIASVLAAMSLVVLDFGMVNVALPTMAGRLGVSPADAVLVLTAYQTALVMALLPCAALGERFGNRGVFQTGVAVFLIGSLLCAFSPSLTFLIAARFVQGLGGAAVMALGVALLRAAVPPGQLGAAVGWNALTVALSSAAAPTLGALIIVHLDWPWLFLINLPVGVLAVIAAMSQENVADSPARLDLISIAMNGALFALLVSGAGSLQKSPGLGIVLLTASAITIVGLVRRERMKPAPLFPLDLLRDGSFRISVIASIFCFMGQTAGMVALPFYLQHSLGQSPLMIGLYLSPWPLAVAVAAALSGWLSRRISSEWLCAMGGSILAVGLAASALWPLTDTPYPLMVFSAVCGAGFGLFQVPNNRNMFLSAPAHRSGAAGGMQGTARLTGQVSGAVMMTLLFSATALSLAPRIGLALGAVLAMTAGLVSLSRSPGAGMLMVFSRGGIRRVAQIFLSVSRWGRS